MRLVTSGATLRECWLVVVGLLPRIGDIAVTGQADFDGVGFGQARLPAGVGTVAIGAIACGAGMGNFGGLDQFSFVVVAGNAQRFDVGLGQHDFSVFGGRVANLALLVSEGRMREFRQQLGRGGFVGVVTAHAIRGLEGLVLVRLLQVGTLDIMTVEAQRRRRLGEVIVELDFPDLSRLMCGVAGIATHVESGVPAAFLGNIEAGRVATKAEVFFLVA